jgi:hypothetical protein
MWPPLHSTRRQNVNRRFDEECCNEAGSILSSQELPPEEKSLQEDELSVWECEAEDVCEGEERDEESDHDDENLSGVSEYDVEEIDIAVYALCLRASLPQGFAHSKYGALECFSGEYAVPMNMLASMVEDWFLFMAHGLPPRPPEFYVDTRLWPEFAMGRRQRRLAVEREYLADKPKRPKFLFWETDK